MKVMVIEIKIQQLKKILKRKPYLKHIMIDLQKSDTFQI